MSSKQQPPLVKIASAKGQEQPVDRAPSSQQAKPQKSSQPAAKPNPQPQPGAQPMTQQEPVPHNLQNVPTNPAPPQHAYATQNTVKDGQASQSQQANPFTNPTKQAENAGDPHTKGRFFLKWGVFSLVGWAPVAKLLGFMDEDFQVLKAITSLIVTFLMEVGIMILYNIMVKINNRANLINDRMFSPSVSAEEKNKEDPNTVGRFFVKWGFLFVVVPIGGLILKWIVGDKMPGVPREVVACALLANLMAMISYYISEGLSYLLLDPSVPAQTTTQPAPMSQGAMQPPLGSLVEK